MSEGKVRRAAVIGSGFGGLAVAIRLQSAGIATTMYEARDLPGGRAYVYRDKGFTFDAGPTVITAPDCLRELFELSGRRLEDYCELMPVNPFYRLSWEDGDAFDYTGDHAAMRQQIEQRNTADAEGYDKFVDYTRRVYEKGYEELVAEPFLRFSDMVRVAPDLMRLRADRSVYNTVAKFVKDERTRQALSFHSLLVGGNPFDTSAIYTLIHYLERKGGVYFPRGGTGALVSALVKLFRELGGELRLSSPVRAVRVRSVDGRSVHELHTDRATDQFDVVVSNADLHQTYDKLFAETSGSAPMRKKLKKVDWSMSLFVLYFGTKKSYDDLAHHTILFGPRYRELLDDIFAGSSLPDDFSLYLHAPTVTDPSMAPPGCGSYYVLSPVPHLGNAQVDWNSMATEYGDRILAALDRLMPGVAGQVVTRRHFTPLDFQSELGAYHGCAFSLAPRLTQSAWFRPHNRDPRIPGLYLVGAGTHPGAGVPGVINSAKATARLIIEEHAA
nr:phytoene dehydrogenase [uncultured bacterium]ANY58043.1 phytoene dehydrogenase [uncultured bacterium]